MARSRSRRPGAAAARRAVSALCCALLLLSSGGAALAAGSGGVLRIGSRIDTGGLRDIEVSGIAPGYRESWPVTVVNERSEPVAVGLRVADLVNDDNGCSVPESREDSTCGAGEGELGAHLVLRVGTPGAPPLFGAVLDEADAGSGQVITVPANGTAEVVVELHLPAGTGNVVQTDSVDFTLVWRAEALPGAGGAPAEGGVRVRSHAAGASGVPGLALTGAKVMLLAGSAVLLVAGGGLLVLLLRRGSDREHRSGGAVGGAVGR